MKKVLSLLVVALTAMAVYAAVTVTNLSLAEVTGFTANTTLSELEEPVTSGNYTFTFTQGNSATAPAYNANSSEVRLYGGSAEVPEGNTMTITTTGADMTQIVLSDGSSFTWGDMSVNTGSVDFDAETRALTWTGEAKEVTFTVIRPTGSKATQFRFANCSITAGKESSANLGDDVTELSQLANDKVYAIHSNNGEGFLCYNEEINGNYVSIVGVTTDGSGVVGDADANAAYHAEYDPADPNGQWQIIYMNDKYYFYNLGAQKFMSRSGRDYQFVDGVVAVDGIKVVEDGVFAIHAGGGMSDGSANFACIVTNTTPQAVRNWLFSDHGSKFYFTEIEGMSTSEVADNMAEAVAQTERNEAMAQHIATAKATLAGAYAYTEGEALITDPSQFFSPYTINDEQEVDGTPATNEQVYGFLLDGDPYTYWHSDWGSGSVANHLHYLQVELNNPVEGLVEMSMARRINKGNFCQNDNPVAMSVEASADGIDFELVGELDVPLTQAPYEPYVKAAFNLNTPAKYLRFFNEHSNAGNDRGYWHCGEFQLYPATLSSECAASTHAAAVAALEAALEAAQAVENATEADLTAIEEALAAYEKAINTGTSDFTGVVSSSLAETTIESVEDLEGLQLTFDGAMSVEVRPEATIAVTDETGMEIYSVWAPEAGSTSNIEGNVVSLLNWMSFEEYMTAVQGKIEPQNVKRLVKRQAEEDVEYWYFEDHGSFIVDGNDDPEFLVELAPVAHKVVKEPKPAYEKVRLSFSEVEEAGNAVVTVTNEKGEVIEGATATLVSVQKHTGDNEPVATTLQPQNTDLLTPRYDNAENNGWILTFNVTGLEGKFKEANADLHAMNVSGGYQNDENIKYWDLTVSTDGEVFGVAERCDISNPIYQDGATRHHEFSTTGAGEFTENMTLTVEVRKVQGGGCFCGLKYLEFVMGEGQTDPEGEFTGVVTSSLADKTVKGIEDFEGMTLTFEGAKSVEVREDGYLIVTEDPEGAEMLYLWTPMFGGTSNVEGNVVTLTGWLTEEQFEEAMEQMGGGPSPYNAKRLVKRQAEEGEGTYVYMEDYGSFIVDGNDDPDFYVEFAPIAFEEEEPVEEFPAEGVAYIIKNVDAAMYLHVREHEKKAVLLSSEPQNLYFTKVEGGYTIATEEGLYVGGHSNTWNVASNVAETWTIEEVEGGYAFHCKQGYLGFDNLQEMSEDMGAAYRNKKVTDHGVFLIEKPKSAADLEYDQFVDLVKHAQDLVEANKVDVESIQYDQNENIVSVESPVAGKPGYKTMEAILKLVDTWDYYSAYVSTFDNAADLAAYLGMYEMTIAGLIEECKAELAEYDEAPICLPEAGKTYVIRNQPYTFVDEEYSYALAMKDGALTTSLDWQAEEVADELKWTASTVNFTYVNADLEEVTETRYQFTNVADPTQYISWKTLSTDNTADNTKWFISANECPAYGSLEFRTVADNNNYRVLVIDMRDGSFNQANGHCWGNTFSDWYYFTEVEGTTPAGEEYALNFDKDLSNKHASRKTNSVSITVEGETQTIEVADNTLVYNDMSEQTFTVAPGATVEPTIGYNGSWMHGYLYIDLDNNKKFDVEPGDAEAEELVSYTFYSAEDAGTGLNSAGETVSNNCNATELPSFVAPTTEGTYRMRYIVDWNCINPGGQYGDLYTNNFIDNNGGAVIDVTLVVAAVDGVGTVLRNDNTEAIYNLQGQRQAKSIRGLNIMGGKKVLVK